MTPIDILLLGTWCIGLLFLVSGLIVTRLNWRPDVRPPSFTAAGSDLAAHPERYVTALAVSLVRRLNLVGMIICIVAVAGLIARALAR